MLSLSHLEQVQPYSAVYVRVLLTYIWPSRNQTCLYLCICSNRDRLGLYAEFSIILGQCTFLWPTAKDVNLNYSPNWRWIVVMSSPSVVIVIMHSIDLIKIVLIFLFLIYVAFRENKLKKPFNEINFYVLKCYFMIICWTIQESYLDQAKQLSSGRSGSAKLTVFNCVLSNCSACLLKQWL